MVKRNEIIDAYVFLREHNCDIPDATLEFIKDAALSAYDMKYDKNCLGCKHNGKQMSYPSGCTGCGGNGEMRNFVPKDGFEDGKG